MPGVDGLGADYDAKRLILEIVYLICHLDGATLVPQIRKAFAVLAEGPLSEKSRDDKTASELFLSGVRALPLQSSIIDVVRNASRISPATG
jgi:hypothetical protein